jgi:MATE family multidrug resistance protein
VTRAARAYFAIRIWSAPIVLANFVVLGWLIGQARAGLALAIQIVINAINMAATVALVIGMNAGIEGAAVAAVVAEAVGLALGVVVARTITHRPLDVPRAVLLDRAKLWRMLAVNRDIMIRTAALIAALLFFTAQGARAGDVTLAANAVLNNFLLISAFFLDGLANAAQQLCGQAYGARDRIAFSDAVRLVLSWGFGFAVVVALVFVVFGPWLIHTMTANENVQQTARGYLWFVVASPLLAVFAFGYDGIFIGATWAREMRNLMILSLLAFLATWFVLRGLGNTGLWIAMLVLYASRGGLQALRYPVNLRASFGDGLSSLSLSEARVKSPASPRP